MTEESKRDAKHECPPKEDASKSVRCDEANCM